MAEPDFTLEKLDPITEDDRRSAEWDADGWLNIAGFRVGRVQRMPNSPVWALVLLCPTEQVAREGLLAIVASAQGHRYALVDDDDRLHDDAGVGASGAPHE